MTNEIVYAIHPVLGRRAFPPLAWKLLTDCKDMNGWVREQTTPPAIVQQTIERNTAQEQPTTKPVKQPGKRGRKPV